MEVHQSVIADFFVEEAVFMKTLDELYQQMLKRAAEGKPVGVDGDPKLIDCLAHPDDHPLIWRVKPCLCPPDEPHHCQEACDWGLLRLVPTALPSTIASASAARPVSTPASSIR